MSAGNGADRMKSARTFIVAQRGGGATAESARAVTVRPSRALMQRRHDPYMVAVSRPSHHHDDWREHTDRDFIFTIIIIASNSLAIRGFCADRKPSAKACEANNLSLTETFLAVHFSHAE